jgi:hypothetical protein
MRVAVVHAGTDCPSINDVEFYGNNLSELAIPQDRTKNHQTICCPRGKSYLVTASGIQGTDGRLRALQV